MKHKHTEFLKNGKYHIVIEFELKGYFKIYKNMYMLNSVETYNPIKLDKLIKNDLFTKNQIFYISE